MNGTKFVALLETELLKLAVPIINIRKPSESVSKKVENKLDAIVAFPQKNKIYALI